MCLVNAWACCMRCGKIGDERIGPLFTSEGLAKQRFFVLHKSGHYLVLVVLR
jgi:hypothetical protein